MKWNVAASGIPLFGIEDNPLDWQGPKFLRFYFTTFILGLFASLIVRHLFRARGNGITPPKALKPHEVAVLAGGEQRAAGVALVSLLQNGEIDIRNGLLLVQGKLPADAGKLQRMIYHLVDENQPATVTQACANCETATAEIRAGLANQGLLETNHSFAFARTLITLLIGRS